MDDEDARTRDAADEQQDPHRPNEDPPVEKLDEDPAYNPDDEGLQRIKGG